MKILSERKSYVNEEDTLNEDTLNEHSLDNHGFIVGTVVNLSSDRVWRPTPNMTNFNTTDKRLGYNTSSK